MEIVWLIAGVVLGGVAAWFMAKSKFSSNHKSAEEINQYKSRLGLAEERKQMLEQEIKTIKPELAQERQRGLDLSNELVRTQTEYKNLHSRLAEQRLEMEKLNGRFAMEFKNLANSIFEEKSQKFTRQNQDNLSQLLNPLREKIGEFQKKVEDANTEDTARNAELVQQIKHLSELNRQITKEAENLTKALKGDSKTQGNWGEVILERILEKSGLEKGREYETQVSEKGEDGKRYQPDVIVKLPDSKNVIIDSKVSLVAYERYVNADDEMEQATQLKMHSVSIRNHVRTLGDKNYQSLYGVDGLDFVLLFIPIEPAFSLAVQHDPELFNDAYSRNIVVVSPTTLIATLRTIASIWKQEHQNKNALDIARKSGALYDKFVAFVDDLKSIGKHLQGAQKAHDESMKKLVHGNGNLIRKTESLKKLGAKATKQLDRHLLDQSGDQ